MKTILILLLSTIGVQHICKAQNKQPKSSKISLTASYGLAGSFFVKSYAEKFPFPTVRNREFNKKNFIGNALNAAIGYRISNNYELKAGIQFQNFTRRAKATDTISNVVVNRNTTIHDRNYMYFVGIFRIFENQKYILSPGIGVYYLDPRQQSIGYGYGIPNYVGIYESQNGDLEEAGIFAELSYEYKFQPKVNLGIKLQGYYTATASYFESVAFLPFVKINF